MFAFYRNFYTDRQYRAMIRQHKIRNKGWSLSNNQDKKKLKMKRKVNYESEINSLEYVNQTQQIEYI